jgi:RNA polymerase sigma-70 factor (ECF subfamily)
MEFPDARWDPEIMVLTDELVAQVDAALESMSEKLRSVLLLHDKEDMAYDEIAQTLNLPIGTVKSRLFLARNHLQQALVEYVQGKGN